MKKTTLLKKNRRFNPPVINSLSSFIFHFIKNGRIICEYFYRNINKKNERNYPSHYLFCAKNQHECVKIILIFVFVKEFLTLFYSLIDNCI